MQAAPTTQTHQPGARQGTLTTFDAPAGLSSTAVRSLPVRPTASWQTAIAGRVRPITTHQLVVAWWLHIEGTLTRRQLRCYFALHEMHERRQYRRDGQEGRGAKTTRPSYSLDELRTLIGGEAPDHELAADVRRLAAVGLASMTDSAITFATSIEQITPPGGDEDDANALAGFWAMLGNIPTANRRRTVPVPRRTLRALAGGFSKGTTAVMLALLIRCLFRHAGDRKGEGRYRIDGRTKGSWIAETFRVSRRAVTEGRQRLIELGWVVPLDTPQLALNKWGTHDRLNPDWTPAKAGERRADTANPPAPPADFPGESASPINRDSSPSENQNQEARPGPPDPATGVSVEGDREKKAARPAPSNRPPSLRDIQGRDLADDRRLLELLRQAEAAGVGAVGKGRGWGGSTADTLDFFALAERARAIGNKPGAMFAWLIHNDKRAFITQSDEDRAAERLRAIRDGADERRREQGPTLPKCREPELDEEGRLVRACILTARKHRVADPFYVARQVRKDWTRDEWNRALSAYEEAELSRWRD